MTLESDTFFDFQSAHECTHFLNFFTFFNLLQMPNNHRMVNTEFLGNLSCSRKRISSQLVIVNFWWPATMFFIFQALVSFARLPEPPPHCTFISSSWAKCIVDVVSYLSCFMTHFELK